MYQYESYPTSSLESGAILIAQITSKAAPDQDSHTGGITQTGIVLWHSRSSHNPFFFISLEKNLIPL